MLFTPVEIQETVNMFMQQKLDVRCITMGISLLDCADSDEKAANQKIYEKIMRKAGNLVKVGQDIEKEFGVPIINKRVSVTPISLPEQAEQNPTLNTAKRSTNAQRNLESTLSADFRLSFKKELLRRTES